MEHRKQHLPLIAAAALLALSGCVTGDAKKSAEPPPRRPDVTQPGVLPPPQEMLKPASAVATSGGVVHAGGIPPGPVATPAVTPAAALSKMMTKPEKKVPATEMAVAWRNRMAYLPDPSRNGAMGAGLAGQLFLYGGEKFQFAQADGTLTIDLIDETPRPAGQPAAQPERWQFDKSTLRKLQTNDETFGRSYVLFLPWPAYKPDITKVKIAARYDPDSGNTLYAAATTVSIDTSAPLGAAPVWDGVTNTVPLGAPKPQLPPQPFSPNALPIGGPVAPAAPPLQPLPIGGGPVVPTAAPLGATPDGLPPLALQFSR